RAAGRDAALRAAVDVAGERGRALGRAAPLVPRPPRARPVSALRVRRAARVILLDTANRVLLTRFSFADGDVVTAGGGVEAGETPAEAARRELVEEAGLEVEAVGACVWTREHAFRNPVSFDVQ